MAVRFIDKGHGSLAGRLGSVSLAWLITVNIAVSLVLWTGMLISHGDSGMAAWLALPGSWDGFVSRSWTLLTYMVTQTGFLHLVFNLLWLCFFGRIAAMMTTDCNILSMYVGGGIAGGIAFLLGDLLMEGSTPLLGASASVMTLIAATAVYQPRMRLNLWLFGRVDLVWIAVISIALTYLGAGGGNSGGQLAHTGGLLFGLWCGWRMKQQKDPNPAITGLLSAVSGWRDRRRADKISKRRRADAELMTGIRGRLADRERLDELLDKIRTSGYTSLTRSERSELNALSNRLNSPRDDL